MSDSPNLNKIVSSLEEKINSQNYSVLEDLFLVGYTTSKPYCVYKDGDREINVQFRSLLPNEVREIHELIHQYNSPMGKAITEQIETLARTITYINQMPLLFSQPEMDKFFNEKKRYPTTVEMAKTILIEKLKSDVLLDMMYEAYLEFVGEIQNNFNEIKKKLRASTSSS